MAGSSYEPAAPFLLQEKQCALTNVHVHAVRGILHLIIVPVTGAESSPDGEAAVELCFHAIPFLYADPNAPASCMSSDSLLTTEKTAQVHLPINPALQGAMFVKPA